MSSTWLYHLFSEEVENDTFLNYTKLAGGDSSEVWKVEMKHGTFVLKSNSYDSYPEMFRHEEFGLNLLRDQSQFRIPKIEYYGQMSDKGYLLMEYIKPTNRQPSDEDAGRKLAMMHQASDNLFGLDHNNYIGMLPQSNNQHETWFDFFREERIKPLIEKNQHYLDLNDIRHFDPLLSKLDRFFPKEPPSLLHGDLWSGNIFFDTHDEPVLIDPAVYYGHRLMDIGMSRLFGGFSNRFYQAYSEIYPLPGNWEEASEVANIYPLLVHLRLFGASYKGRLMNIVKRYA